MNIEASKEARHPKKCPICGSKRIKVISTATLEGIREDSENHQSFIKGIHAKLLRLPDLPLDEQERIRLEMMKMGIHILSADERRGGLDEVLTKEEAERYLSLIRKGGYGLATIGHTVVAVSPSSPLRIIVGVSEHKLHELKRALEK